MERKNERLPIFTERFRELQGKQSNTDFAEFLGISRQTVGFYWNGDRVPDALTLIKIAQKCSVSADWLLGLTEVSSKSADIREICEFTMLNEQAVCKLHELNQMEYVHGFFNSLILQPNIRILEKNIRRAVAAWNAYNRQPPGPGGKMPMYKIQDMTAEEYDEWKRLEFEAMLKADEGIDNALNAGEYMKISHDEAAELFIDRAASFLHGTVDDFISSLVEREEE